MLELSKCQVENINSEINFYTYFKLNRDKNFNYGERVQLNEIKGEIHIITY